MNRWRLIRNNLWFYRRTYFGVVLGIALSCAIIVGALAVGDSVRSSLKSLSRDRLGQTEFAMTPRERYVRQALVEELETDLKVPVIGAIHALGIAGKPSGDRQLSGIHLYGVTEKFWSLGPTGTSPEPELADGAWINAQLAASLAIQPGETLVIRMEKPSLLPRDAVVNAVEDVQVSLRVKVSAILDNHQFGNFNLEVNQLPPENIFLPLKLLQETLEQPAKVNMILIGASQDHQPQISDADLAFRKLWQLEDAGIELRDLPQQGAVEIRTGRIFFDPVSAEIVSQLAANPTKILTYLVNSLKVGDRTTPYAMVTAIEPANPTTSFPQWIQNDGILLNQWTWQDLTPSEGAPLTMTYFAIDQAGKLATHQAQFKVVGAIANEGPIDPNMMPSYPGLADSENCRDWDTGIPIDLDAIREKDEAYWDRYKGTPKAIITLARGQSIWENRFGNLTAVRYPSVQTDSATLKTAILAKLEPASLGLFFNPVGAMAAAATNGSMDFSGLFVGFSFFIIIAALLLTALLTTFSLEQRAPEAGTLLALGLPHKQLRRMFFKEALLLCLPAAVLGMGLGWLFSTGILSGLTTLWQDAVGQWSLGYHFSSRAFALGTLIGLAIAMAAIWPTLRRFRQVPLRLLLTGELRNDGDLASKRKPLALILAVLTLGGGFTLVLLNLNQPEPNQTGLFFGAGSLLLIGGLAAFSALLQYLAGRKTDTLPSQFSLAIQNLARRRGRSMSIAAMLACGAFLVFSLESYRQDAQVDGDRRDSGSGGFALFAQTTIPLYRDLNLAVNRDQYGLDETLFQAVATVPMRLLSGDDASCLNLNRAQQPRVLGLNPVEMAQRKAFRFKVRPEIGQAPWLALKGTQTAKEVPAFVDYNTLTYSLHLKVGDALEYVNEKGDPFRIRIIGAFDNSLFQGSLVIDEDAFEKHYPSQSGYRWFLLDTPQLSRDDIARELEATLGDKGMRVRLATDVLNAYNQVQNTYISIFQVLGALGLILGSFGMGVLVLRNILERRAELALLRAVGFRKKTLRKLLVYEHGFLFLMGLGCGLIASSVAILPKILTPNGTIPWLTLTLLATALLFSGCFWTWIAARWALRGELIPALRKE